MIDKSILEIIKKSVEYNLCEYERRKLFDYFSKPENFEQALILFTKILGMDDEHKFSRKVTCPTFDCESCKLYKHIINGECMYRIFDTIYDKLQTQIPKIKGCIASFKDGKYQVKDEAADYGSFYNYSVMEVKLIGQCEVAGFMNKEQAIKFAETLD